MSFKTANKGHLFKGINFLKERKKEIAEKRNMKKAFLENKKNICRVVLPSLCIICFIICLIVYIFTRPKQ